jgi:hypothetical protein
VSAHQVGQSSRAIRIISARTLLYSCSARDLIRAGLSSVERRVWTIFAANSAGPIRPSPSEAGRTTSRRWASNASSARRAMSAAARSLGSTAATAASLDAASASRSASSINSPIPDHWPSAFSVWSRDTGRSPEPIVSRAASSTAGMPSSRPAIDASRSGSGAKSRAISEKSPSPSM